MGSNPESASKLSKKGKGKDKDHKNCKGKSPIIGSAPSDDGSPSSGNGLDYSDISGLNDKFLNDYTGSIEDISTRFDDFLKGLNQFKDNIEGKGISTFNRSNDINSCPFSKSVLLGYKSVSLEIDICKFISPSRELVYYLSYAFFFLLFLSITIKIFLFTI